MPFKVLVDACVVYPQTLRDVLLSTAHAGLYQLYWSDLILDEAFRNLVKNGMQQETADKHAASMRRAFPESTVEDFEHLIPSMRCDPKDRHVVAAAVKAGAQVIVTANIKDFYDLPSGVEAQTPDAFMCNLFDLSPERVMGALDHMVSRLTRPPTTAQKIAEVVGPEFLQMVIDHQAGA